MKFKIFFFGGCLLVFFFSDIFVSFTGRETHYSLEELLGMVLNYSRELAQDFAGQFG